MAALSLILTRSEEVITDVSLSETCIFRSCSSVTLFKKKIISLFLKIIKKNKKKREKKGGNE